MGVWRWSLDAGLRVTLTSLPLSIDLLCMRPTLTSPSYCPGRPPLGLNLKSRLQLEAALASPQQQEHSEGALVGSLQQQEHSEGARRPLQSHPLCMSDSMCGAELLRDSWQQQGLAGEAPAAAETAGADHTAVGALQQVTGQMSGRPTMHALTSMRGSGASGSQRLEGPST